jgi:predicted nucleic acid binding AN1-type Zn finger protein
MEVLDKGKHCEEEYCHQLDLLPMQCKACKKYFCASHFKYESHNCKQSDRFNYVIPQCDICKQTIEFSRDKDIDLCLAEHLQKCLNLQENGRSNQSNRFSQTQNRAVSMSSLMPPSSSKQNTSKKCNFKNCKSKEVFRFDCEKCSLTYCNKHRLPEIHECDTVLANRRVNNRLIQQQQQPQSCSRQYSRSLQQPQQQQTQQQQSTTTNYRKLIRDYFSNK